MQRGRITYHTRARQQRDYSGVRYGNITPTDIDGIIDYKNRCWVIIELKYMDATIPFGQMLCLERLTDDLQRVKPTLCIIASHMQHNPELDIDVANSLVTHYRKDSMWFQAQGTVKQTLDNFLGDWD